MYYHNSLWMLSTGCRMGLHLAMGALDALAAGLRRVRAERGFTQQLVAERAAVSLQFYAAVEQGKKAPSFDTLDALCQVLGVEPAELLGVGSDSAARRTSASPDLIQAIDRMPRAHDDELLAIVHAVSRMVIRPSKREMPAVKRRGRV